jgi:hypothetical protein
MTLSDFEVTIVRVMTPMKLNENNKIMEEVAKIIRNQRILLLLVVVILVLFLLSSLVIGLFFLVLLLNQQ